MQKQGSQHPLLLLQIPQALVGLSTGGKTCVACGARGQLRTHTGAATVWFLACSQECTDGCQITGCASCMCVCSCAALLSHLLLETTLGRLELHRSRIGVCMVLMQSLYKS